jgi:hypothetical protein
MKKFILIRVLSGVVLLVAVLVTMSLFSIPHFVNPLAELKVEDVEAVEVWYYDRTALLEGEPREELVTMLRQLPCVGKSTGERAGNNMGCTLRLADGREITVQVDGQDFRVDGERFVVETRMGQEVTTFLSRHAPVP